jgi:hypothetical protein
VLLDGRLELLKSGVLRMEQLPVPVRRRFFPAELLSSALEARQRTISLTNNQAGEPCSARTSHWPAETHILPVICQRPFQISRHRRLTDVCSHVKHAARSDWTVVISESRTRAGTKSTQASSSAASLTPEISCFPAARRKLGAG